MLINPLQQQQAILQNVVPAQQTASNAIVRHINYIY